MPVLPSDAGLPDYQRYVAELEAERGFSRQDVLQKCLMLGEEVGELFKAVRRRLHMKVDPDSQTLCVDEELADILIFLCSIANRMDVDLADAFLKKETRNRLRSWE